MKTLRLSLLAVIVAGTFLVAQPPLPDNRSPSPAMTGAPTLSAERLEQLLGPIALYPDALIALILPASTVPTDIVLAARQLRDNPNDRSQIEHRGWDESVKSLTHYPEVLQWLDENLSWTQQVGQAFLLQPAEVMQTIQRLRATARAAGTLADTPQQRIITETNVIRIVPAQPDIIYVPHYEPEIVYVPQLIHYPRPVISFGVGAGAGSWLAYDFDWHRNTLWCANRHRPWGRHDWRRPIVPIAPMFTHVPPPGVRPWRPSAPLPARPFGFPHQPAVGAVVRPTPFGFARSSTVRSSQPNPGTVIHHRMPASNGRHPPAPSLAPTYFHRVPSERSAIHSRGVTPAPSPAARAYSQITPTVPFPSMSPRPAHPPRVANPSGTQLSRPPGVTNHGIRRGSSNHEQSRDAFDRSSSSASSAPVMGPMPSARTLAPNRTLSQPSAPGSAPSRNFPRMTPPAAAPASPVPPATHPASPPIRELNQPGTRGRSGNEARLNSGAASSQGSSGRHGHRPSNP